MSLTIDTQNFKFALGIEYDGTNYHGWQKQKNAITIQGKVDTAISKVANHLVDSTCAGRTDKGVHAIYQVIHFSSSSKRTLSEWLLGINANLPLDIRVIWIKEVPLNFHARFSAIQRRYKYYIYNLDLDSNLDFALNTNQFSNTNLRSPFLLNNVTFYPKRLNANKMHEAAHFWVGEHDFSSFKDSECQSTTPSRLVKEITVVRKNNLVIFDIIANSFLHHMVRNMVGTLLEIGSGKQKVNFAQKVLLAKDRTQAGITAPSSGLYFVDVVYSKQFDLPRSCTEISDIDTIAPWFFRF